MFPQIRRSIQCAMVVIVLCTASVSAAQDEESFYMAGDFPWVGWHGPVADGFDGLRFGIGGFEVNRIMQSKDMTPSHARAYTLRFDGDILRQPAELIAEFTRKQPSQSDAALRVIQIRWIFGGLPQLGLRLFGQLDGLLQKRYGVPVLSREDSASDLEAGDGHFQRLYYGPEAQAWLEMTSLGMQHYSLLIRLECPQYPDPRKEE